MNVRGLMNMQYAIADDKVRCFRSKSTCFKNSTLVSKVCNINMVKLATDFTKKKKKAKKERINK